MPGNSLVLLLIDEVPFRIRMFVRAGGLAWMWVPIGMGALTWMRVLTWVRMLTRVWVFADMGVSSWCYGASTTSWPASGHFWLLFSFMFRLWRQCLWRRWSLTRAQGPVNICYPKWCKSWWAKYLPCDFIQKGGKLNLLLHKVLMGLLFPFLQPFLIQVSNNSMICLPRQNLHRLGLSYVCSPFSMIMLLPLIAFFILLLRICCSLLGSPSTFFDSQVLFHACGLLQLAISIQ